jgi:hypothetical protein
LFRLSRVKNVAGGCLVLALSISASAIPISGEIHFLGTYTPIDNSGNSTSLGLATGLDFNNPNLVVGASGDFADYVSPWLSTATFVDSFSFNPLNPSPVDALWSAGGFQFTLTAVDVLAQSQDLLSLVGTGEISGNGFDATPGTWNLFGGKFLFYANDTASSGAPTQPIPVPDGGSTLMLLGAILLGVCFVGARTRRAPAALN